MFCAEELREIYEKQVEVEHKMHNRRFYDGTLWKKVRKLIIQRDKVCQRCGSADKLRVHHIDRVKENVSYDNLVTLCLLCHQREHGLFVKASP